ncbi:MAG: DUF6134 family protein [Reyranella sp.]|nr:DUF6134 family protein [Reyranella sp.]
MRRLFLASILVATGAVSAAAADDFPYGNTHSFTVYRNGQPIGTHTLTFQHSGDKRAVSTSIDFAVKAMGMTVYRYSHRGNEIWNGSTLQSIDTKTDDNGKLFTMQAHQNGNQLAVERKAPEPAAGAAMNDQGLQRNNSVAETLPATMMPSTHWNQNQVKQSTLLNTQYGTPSKVKITDLGRETIKTASRSIEATHYRYAGDITMDQWFDERGRWVKAAFKAFDGSEIEYILQE